MLNVDADLTTWNPFEELSPHQRSTLDGFQDLLLGLNRRLNLISASSEAQFRLLHLVHSLSLSYKSFPSGSTVIDFGTGGGLPGIPLAIRFPDVEFCLIDSIRKKTQAVRFIAQELDLNNVTVWNGRVENWPGSADYAVSRATSSLLVLWQWYSRLKRSDFREIDPDKHWEQGLICLKGGDLTSELADLSVYCRDNAFGLHLPFHIDQLPLAPLLDSPIFHSKFIVALTV